MVSSSGHCVAPSALVCCNGEASRVSSIAVETCLRRAPGGDHLERLAGATTPAFQHTGTVKAWPGDSRQLRTWCREEILGALEVDGLRVRGKHRLRVDAEVSGSDVVNLQIDATGLEFSFSGGFPDTEPEAEPEPVTRTPGHLHTARVIADPVRVQGFNVSLLARVTDLPIEWWTHARPRRAGQPLSAFALGVGNEAAPPSVSLGASMRTRDLGPLLRAILNPALSEAGGRVRRLRVELAQDPSDRITANAVAAVRWRVLFGTVRAHATVRVTPEAVVHIEDLRVSSANPVIAISLLAARPHLRRLVGSSHDLHEHLDPSELRINDLDVSIDHEITISGRIAVPEPGTATT